MVSGEKKKEEKKRLAVAMNASKKIFSLILLAAP